MYVKIGKYPSWDRAETKIARLLSNFGLDEDKTEEVLRGKHFRLAFKPYYFVRRTINRIIKSDPTKRKSKVRIGDDDIFSLDQTLAIIILPALKKFRAEMISSPDVDDSDVPASLKNADIHARWQWVVDEMIWSFEQYGTDWEKQYWSGTFDVGFFDKPQLDGTLKKCFGNGPNHTAKLDKVAYLAHQKRISNGLALFGKYYQSLWI